MRVGWVGLGKIGLPIALCLAKHGGHQVTGYDVSPRPWQVMDGEQPPMQEEGIQELLQAVGPSGISRAGSIADVVRLSDIVFVSVQTPHAPQYGGEQPAPGTRRDFEYAYLIQACRDICAAARSQRKNITLAVVSTVLPGTSGKHIRPLLGPWVRLAYTPQFIAMGTTITDFLNPEFVICGVDDPADAQAVSEVFSPVHGADLLYVTEVETAEAIKVFYNTFISMKIVFANMVMEVCHKTGADCDEVSGALALATDRLISPRYLRGGMGDGGACHPRDLIALSWLAQRLELSYDLLGEVAKAREAQTAWLASLIREYHGQTGYGVVILGRAYKPGSDLTDGSPAILLARYLEDLLPPDLLSVYDPRVRGYGDALLLPEPETPSVFAVATEHPEFARMKFPRGSVVIDPFGLIADQPGVTVVRVGRK